VFNLFAWAGFRSPLPRYNQPEAVVEEVIECAAEEAAPADTLVVAAE
jgi:hypothetical protein